MKALRLLLLTTLLSLLGVMEAQAKEAYYTFSANADALTATFYYDDQWSQRDNYHFVTNDGTPLFDNQSMWTYFRSHSNDEGILELYNVFDSSFADYRPTNTSYWFSSLTMPTYVNFGNLANLNTSQVTNMSHMFNNLNIPGSAFDLSHFDTSKVTDMSYMLANLNFANPISLDLSSFTFNSGVSTTGLLKEAKLESLTIPASANNLASDAFQGLRGPNDYGEEIDYCCLYAPEGFIPQGATLIDGYWKFSWKGGDFCYYAGKLPYCSTKYNPYYLSLNYDNQYQLSEEGDRMVPNNGTSMNFAPDYDYGDVFEFESSFADYRPTNTSHWFENLGDLYGPGSEFRLGGMENFNTSEVTNMSYMFHNTIYDEGDNLDLSHFNTANVVDMSYMFAGFINKENVEYGEGDSHYSVGSLDISSFTINPTTNTNYMFKDAEISSITIPASANNLANNAFSGVGTAEAPCVLICPEGFTPQGTTQYNTYYFTWKGGYFRDSSMKEAYYALEYEDEPFIFEDNTAYFVCKYVFYYDNQRQERSRTRDITQNGTPLDFSSEYGIVDRKSIVFDSSFADFRPTNTSHWFHGLRQDPIVAFYSMENLNTSDVTDMSYMFYGIDGALEGDLGDGFIDLSHFDTRKATNMSYMFSDIRCIPMLNLDLSSFTINAGCNTQGMMKNSTIGSLTVPATGNNLAADACEGVGRNVEPSTLIYLSSFTLQGATSGSSYIQWKGGYFVQSVITPYAYLDGETLIFKCDGNKVANNGISLNTGTTSPGWYQSRTTVKKVVFDSSFKKARPTTCYRWFSGMTNLTSIVGIENLKTDEVTNMQYMFGSCSSLTDLDLSGLNTANVTSMFYMFYGCSSLESLNLNGFNTANVAIMSSMFSGCNSLESLNMSGFNTTNVTSMVDMFYGCSSLTSLDLSGFNTANVTNMTAMFSGCSSLESLDLSEFYFNSECNTSNMMRSCSGLKELVIPATAGNLNGGACNGVGTQLAPCTLFYPTGFEPETTNSGTSWYQWKAGYFRDSSMKGAYYALEYEDETEYDLYNIAYRVCKYVFYYDNQRLERSRTRDITQNGTPLDFSSEYEIVYRKSIVFDSSFADFRPTNTSHWFHGLSQYPVVAFYGMENLNTSEVTDMSYMFYGIDGDFEGDLGDGFIDLSHFDTRKVTNMSYMFSDIRRYHLYGLDLSSFTINANCNTQGMIKNSTIKRLTVPATGNNLAADACEGVGSENLPCWLFYPSDLTLQNVTLGDGWYQWKGGYFKDVDPEPYAVLSTDNTTLTFYYDKLRDSRTGNPFDINTGSNSPEWFNYRTNITKVVFDPSFTETRPKSCYWWFYDMPNLTSIIGIENLNTDEVTNMAFMFSNSHELTSLDLRHFNTAKVTDMSFMFAGCYNLTSLNVSGFNTANVINMEDMFYACNSLTSLDVSGFNTAKVTVMSSMFGDNYSLTSLNLSNFTFKPETETDGLLENCSSLHTLVIPATAHNLNATNACAGVGTQSAPCALVYPDGFNLVKDAEGDGWYQWKSGYFKDAEAYAIVSTDGTTLTFYYDGGKASRTSDGTVYALNKGYVTPGWYTNRTSVTSVVFDASFANARPTSCYYWFMGMSQVTEIADIKYLNTENVTNMAHMFQGCKGLTSLDLSNFNTDNVNDMTSLFNSCSGLTSLDLSNFNTAKVTDMYFMFAYCKGLTSLDLSNFSTASVTNMSDMFYSCSGLTSLNVSSFNTTKVTNMSYMFSSCSSLTSLNLSSFSTAKVTNMSYMFNGCKGLTSLDLSNFNTDNVTDMTSLFGSCSGLTSLDLSNFNTASATNMSYMFYSCSGLTSLNVSSFNTTIVTNMSSMFDKCSSLTSLDVSGFSTSSVKIMDHVFMRCSSLTSLDVSNFNTENVTNMAGMFNGCSGLTSLDLSNFNTAKVTSMSYMFAYCNGLTNLNLSNFNTASVTTMSSMFYGCKSLTSLDLSNFNTTIVTEMDYMFASCSSLTSLDLSNFNTASVTKMSYMFYSCSGLTSLDLSSFTFNDGTSTNYYLYICSSLKTLTIPETAGNLNSGACTGVGTQAAPCTLIYPEGFTPEKTDSGSDWYRWKGGYFKDASNLRGDANGDGYVSLIDVMQVVSYILDDVPEGFIFANAEMDGDNIISLTDLMMIVSIILEQPTTSIPASARQSMLDGLALTANGHRVTLHLDNSEPCLGISFTVILPADAEIGNLSIPVSRSDGHQVFYKAVSPGRYNVVLYANSGTVLRDGTTAVLRFDITGCQADDITVCDIQMVNSLLETILLPATRGITTGIADLDSEDDGSQPYYNTVGIGTNSPTRGVYIRNGKKIVVK